MYLYIYIYMYVYFYVYIHTYINLTYVLCKYYYATFMYVSLSLFNIAFLHRPGPLWLKPFCGPVPPRLLLLGHLAKIKV